MDVLGDSPLLWWIFAAALPGITYTAARSHARGIASRDATLSSRFAEGFVAAVLLDLVYIVLLGERLVRALSGDALRADPGRGALVALLLGILVPAVLAWVIHRGHVWTRPTTGALANASRLITPIARRVRGWLRGNFGALDRRFSATPHAWDFALPNRSGTFVRIETIEGRFLGGWFATASFFSTYPEPHDIFIELEYHLSKHGEFLDPVAGSMGVWYSPRPGDTISWILPPANETEEGR